MISRPLDLAGRMRPAPRNFDVFFYVNVGAIALFFVLFGSRFVLSPGLSADFVIPATADPIAGAAPTDVIIAVQRSNMALVDGAVIDFAKLREWLAARAKDRPGSRLLVQAGASVSVQDMTEIYAMAAEAGFAGVVVAAERPIPEAP